MFSIRIKPTSLNNHGIAHFVLPLVVIVLVAIGGTAFMVASHADAKTAKKPHITASYGRASAEGAPYREDGKWCQKFFVSYRMKTSGTVDHVTVKPYGSTANDLFYDPIALTYRGDNYWGASDSNAKARAGTSYDAAVTYWHDRACVAKLGQKVKLHGFYVVASYGNKSVTKTVHFKGKVKVQ